MALKGCQKLIKVEILEIFHSRNFWEKYSYPVPIYVATLDPEVLSQTIPQISTWFPTQNLCDSDFFFSVPQILKLSPPNQPWNAGATLWHLLSNPSWPKLKQLTNWKAEPPLDLWITVKKTTLKNYSKSFCNARRVQRRRLSEIFFLLFKNRRLINRTD